MSKFKKDKGKSAIKADRVKGSSNDDFVFISIKNVQPNFECFSDWTTPEMAKFWKFNHRLHETTWKQVYETASKGKEKRGFALTYINRDKYSTIPFIQGLSEDIRIFELRVDDTMRVHGFRVDNVFYLCLLDRTHRICP